jgi:cysteine desulfurase
LIYLDNNATTRPAAEVVDAMLPYLREHWGNASSAHGMGRMPEGALVQARSQMAAFLGCQPAEVVFNGGGTEGINHALRGVFEAFPAKRHLVTSAVEHSALRAVATWLQRQGVEVTEVGVDSEGNLDLEALRQALRPDTALVSVMAANNETGVVFPIAEVAALAKARGALLHVDAVQAAGKVPLAPLVAVADLLNLSGHKFHGPKGAGALYIRRGLRPRPLMLGGHQERERRGGTENVPALVGLGAAAELAASHLPDMERVCALRDRLEEGILAGIPEVRVHGAGAPRIANTSLLGFAGLEGEALLLRLDQRGICVSTGSACTTGQREPSHVLRAMGVPAGPARGTIRISLSRETTGEEIEAMLAVLPGIVQELRSLGALAR